MLMSEAIDFTSMVRLDGRGIVVLGAGGIGIGEACTKMLAAGGADLLCVNIDRTEAERMAQETGGEAYVADIMDRAQVKALFEYADKKFGDRFHGFVDIIGNTLHGALEEFDDDAIEQQLSLNLRHAVYAAQYAGPMLRKTGKGGSMVFISSLAGNIVSPGHAFYGVGKAALNHFMRYCADEFGPAGVRSNCIGTGLIQYPSMETSVPVEIIEQLNQGTALRRAGKAIEIAGAVHFLMSDLSTYVTGTVLNVEGGRMLGTGGIPRSGMGTDLHTREPVAS